MTAWGRLEREHPDLVGFARTAFAERKFKCLATLRRSGEPRLSEITGLFDVDDDLWLGLIPSAKQRDLERDPRFWLHCGSAGDSWGVSARLAGEARRSNGDDTARFAAAMDRDAVEFPLYRLNVDELLITRPAPDSGEILMQWWSTDDGRREARQRPG